MRTWTLVLLLLSLTAMPSCMWKIGADLAAGFLDETSGEGRSDRGLEAPLRRLKDDGVLAELVAQILEPLKDGATELSPEQQASLEAAIAGVLEVTAERTAAGLRDEVSPALREMVRQDIVGALAEGLRGDLGESLEETIDAVITRAVYALQRALEDPETKEAMASLFRESMYMAMREGRPGSQSVGDTLQETLTANVLLPVESSVGGLTEVVADRVDESAQRTENTLKAVISALVIILGVVLMAYLLRGRQLMRARQAAGDALRLMDEGTRARIMESLPDYQGIVGGATPKQPGEPKPPPPSTDYFRDDG